jgi:hypothetical protein
MAHELRGVDTFISSRLQADATLWTLIGGRFYTRPAPTGTAPPYVIATHLSSIDRNALGPGTRIFSRVLYLIRVITKDPNTATSDAIADRIDDALVGIDGSVPAQDIFIGKVFREEAIRYEETTPAGEVFQHTGGRYRFFVERLGG